MRIERELNHWIIVRGKEGGRQSFFCFFVDHDKSSWTTKKPWACRQYPSKQAAQVDLTELARRRSTKRQQSKKIYRGEGNIE